MKRRSASKLMLKIQNEEIEIDRQEQKFSKYSQFQGYQLKLKEVKKKIKQNLMASLTEIFHQSRNEPILIQPWMKEFKLLEQKIIGTNYVIVGPSQSGKYSAVKYALGKYHAKVKQIFIDCKICKSQRQICQRLLLQFQIKAPQCEWPENETQRTQLLRNESIDFCKLNPYIEKTNIKFVVIIRNGQHLVGFKKQSILYNLFEWMSSELMKERAGLVILTRNLMLIDRFQKRVRSRFCGNKLCIFRPTEPQTYIKIIIKRIEAVIEDIRVWKGQQELSSKKKSQIYYSDDETNTRTKQRVKKPLKPECANSINYEEFFQKQNQFKYVKQAVQYGKILTSYLPQCEYNQIGLVEFFEEKILAFQNQVDKQNMELYSRQSILSSKEKILCLIKLIKAIQNNNMIHYYLKSKIIQYQIITIPFILRCFQHIFLTLEQTILKELPVDKLSLLIFRLLQKNVEFQFPVNVLQSNTLESLNNIQLLLLILIFQHIVKGQISGKKTIRLTQIHRKYQPQIHKLIYRSANGQSRKLPLRIIEGAIDRLYRSQIISYQPFNKWNSEIILLMERAKIQIGLQNIIKHRLQVRDIIKQKLKDLNKIKSEPTQKVNFNLTFDQKT